MPQRRARSRSAGNVVPATVLHLWGCATGQLITETPTIDVEVLSESTEDYDRGSKAAHYRRIASLDEYVFVSQREAFIEVWRRNERGRWELAVEARSGDQVELTSAGGAMLSVDAIYANPLE